LSCATAVPETTPSTRAMASMDRIVQSTFFIEDPPSWALPAGGRISRDALAEL
jgi:hypothetical protein